MVEAQEDHAQTRVPSTDIVGALGVCIRTYDSGSGQVFLIEALDPLGMP